MTSKPLLFWLYLPTIPIIIKNMRIENIIYYQSFIHHHWFRLKLEKSVSIFVIGFVFVCLFIICSFLNTKFSTNVVKVLPKEAKDSVIQKEEPDFVLPIVPGLHGALPEEPQYNPDLRAGMYDVSITKDILDITSLYKENVDTTIVGKEDNDVKDDVNQGDKEETDKVPDVVSPTTLTHSGSLRKDYCIGKQHQYQWHWDLSNS